MEYNFENEALSNKHDRASFNCGVDALNLYFRTQVMQDVRRRMTKCRVAVDTSNGKVAGFYTLSAAGINLNDLPPDMAKGLPRYPLPAFRMGRLAVDLNYHRLRLGEALLFHARDAAMNSEVGGFALIVDAKDDTAKAFYLKYGFRSYGSLPLQLILVFPKTR
jgi:ribosomal protein S18 acetylase RimI-like enzyme